VTLGCPSLARPARTAGKHASRSLKSFAVSFTCRPLRSIMWYRWHEQTGAPAQVPDDFRPSLRDSSPCRTGLHRIS